MQNDPQTSIPVPQPPTPVPVPPTPVPQTPIPVPPAPVPVPPAPTPSTPTTPAELPPIPNLNSGFTPLGGTPSVASVAPATPLPSSPTSTFKPESYLNPQIASQPTAQVTTNSGVDLPEYVIDTSKTNKNFFFFGFLVFLLFLVVSGLAGAYAIAYNQIDINNPKISEPITMVIQSLPFTPKTPDYLFKAAALASEKVSRQNFDLSVALDSPDLASTLQTTTLEAEIKGDIDVTDVNNPKYQLVVSVANKLEVEVKGVDSTKIYFKINQLPNELLALAGMTEDQITPFTSDWVVYDTTPLQIDAKQYLDQNQTKKSPVEDYSLKILPLLKDQRILDKTKVISENLDGIPTYKVSFNPDDNTINYLENKLNAIFKSPTRSSKASDSLKDIYSDFWFDQKTHYLRKAVVSFRASSPSSNQSLKTNSSEFNFAISLKFDNFGETFEVTPPIKTIEFSKFIEMIQAKSAELEARQSQSNRLTPGF